MNEAKRAYNILRGYVSREWDRIKEVERDLAENELDEAMREPAAKGAKAEDIEAATDELAVQVDREGIARKMLGVKEDATFATIRTTFERIRKRSDPTRFPADSPEQKQAEQILKRAYWAYNVLTENVDSTEKRFRSLQIE